MTVRHCIVKTTVAIQAAIVLEREARQLHDSYTVVGKTTRWECADAQRDHDKYIQIAKDLRASTKVTP